METNVKAKIILTIGQSFSMEGVNDIRGFDDGYVSLDTASGKITVEGSDLKIESLTKEGGNIFISGNVSGVFVLGNVEKKKGILGRFFT